MCLHSVTLPHIFPKLYSCECLNVCVCVEKFFASNVERCHAITWIWLYLWLCTCIKRWFSHRQPSATPRIVQYGNFERTFVLLLFSNKNRFDRIIPSFDSLQSTLYTVYICKPTYIRWVGWVVFVMILPLTRHRKLETVYIDQTNVRVYSCISVFKPQSQSHSVLVLFLMLLLLFFFFFLLSDSIAITCSILEFSLSLWVSAVFFS